MLHQTYAERRDENIFMPRQRSKLSLVNSLQGSGRPAHGRLQAPAALRIWHPAVST